MERDRELREKRKQTILTKEYDDKIRLEQMRKKEEEIRRNKAALKT
jgi:hypothetical protein